MAVAAIEITGFVGSALGIIQFGMANFAQPETAKSVIKIGVGLDTKNGLNNAGGDLPDVRLFNEDGEFLGMSADPGDIDDGSTQEIQIEHHDDNGQQATYALFSTNDDAICIAYASITWPDGNEYAWEPNTVPEGKDQDYFCYSGPPFKWRTDKDPNGITHWTINNGSKHKRSATAQAYGPSKKPRLPRRHLNARDETVTTGPRFDEQLVMDNSSDHATTQLCESETSVGPDFLNIADGLFCRMSDKTLWPICDDATTDGCFSLEEQQLVINGVVQRTKKYSQVVTWGK
ncbi:hypothetical protein QQZ08_004367 [Neonectria magnoliae]|uniref:Uncharacterized protein n=1 Tax=Neonectria magnoliae TaxID=2732573 RepID=A0ABR1I8M3_9HYPO